MADSRAGRLTRRRLLVGAAGLAAGGAVAGGIAYGPRAVDRLARDCGPAGAFPRPSAWTVTPGTFSSAHVTGPVRYALGEPPGRTGAVPVVICLPGRGGSGEAWLRRLRMADVAAGAGTAIAVAAVDGGESYWHPRRGGENRMAMLVDEFLPLLVDRGLGVEASKRSLLGWSMGGYGAILAAIESPEVFARVAVASPALWRSAGETAPGAFDDAADFSRYDVIERAKELTVPLHLSCGTGDPFHDAARLFSERVRPSLVTASFEPGCHDDAYWRRMAPDQVGWLVA